MKSHHSPILTDRLELVPASADLIRRALDGHDHLARALRAGLPPDWPPEFYDADALAYTLERLEKDPAYAGWSMHLFVRRSDRLLVGNGGYYGPPDASGTVEVGYAVVSSMQNRGYATEAAGALAERAFADPRVRRVAARTLPDRIPSIRVLEKLGFATAAENEEPGVIRLERQRTDDGR